MPRATQPFCTGTLSAALPFQDQNQTLLVVVEVLYGRTKVYEAPQLRSVQFRCTRTSCPMQRLGPATPTLPMLSGRLPKQKPRCTDNIVRNAFAGAWSAESAIRRAIRCTPFRVPKPMQSAGSQNVAAFQCRRLSTVHIEVPANFCARQPTLSFQICKAQLRGRLNKDFSLLFALQITIAAESSCVSKFKGVADESPFS